LSHDLEALDRREEVRRRGNKIKPLILFTPTLTLPIHGEGKWSFHSKII